MDRVPVEHHWSITGLMPACVLLGHPVRQLRERAASSEQKVDPDLLSCRSSSPHHPPPSPVPEPGVAGFSADPANALHWHENIKSIEWKTDPTLKVGSQIQFVARFLGSTLRYSYEIVESTPFAKLVMRTAQGPFPMETTYTWAAEGETSTRMGMRNRGRPAGLLGIVSPVMSVAMRRANQKDLSRLRNLLEGR
jgi:polyketide cyclase/dehydrase/lipid transport protein